VLLRHVLTYRLQARIGNAYLKKKDTEKAIEYYEKAQVDNYDDAVHQKLKKAKAAQKKKAEEVLMLMLMLVLVLVLVL